MSFFFALARGEGEREGEGRERWEEWMRGWDGKGRQRLMTGGADAIMSSGSRQRISKLMETRRWRGRISRKRNLVEIGWCGIRGREVKNHIGENERVRERERGRKRERGRERAETLQEQAT